MAQLIGDLRIIGSLGQLSLYKDKDSDKILVKRKGGPSAEKIKHDPKFERTRENCSEFGGRARAARWVRNAIGRHQWLFANGRILGRLNKLLMPIQNLDLTSGRGERNVCISTNPQLMAGLDLNKKNTFDSVINAPLQCRLSRSERYALLEIPELIPNINLNVSGKYPLYMITAAYGVVPDLYYTHNYSPTGEYWSSTQSPLVEYNSDWYPVMGGSYAMSAKLQLPDTPPDHAFSLMLSVGIRFGTIGPDNKIISAEKSGSVKILALV